MLRTYKFRIYPTREQEEKLAKHFGHTRFVYNFFLNYANIIYRVMERPTYYNEWASVLVKLKKTNKYSWLNEVNSQALQQSLKDLERAFKNFFKKQASYPKFKKKKFSRQTFRIPQHIQLYIKEDNPKYGCIFVPKFKEGIKVRLHRKLPKDGKIKQATFIKTPTNKYYAAIVFEVQDAEVQNTSTDILGIDLGIKDTITLSDGKKYKMPDLSKYERQIKRLHRRLSRKQRGSKNWEKARLRLAKLYEKIVNIKNDWLHKITHDLVSESQAGKIVVEDLNIKGMVQNHRLARHIHMQSWRRFLELLEYKAKRCGIEVIKANRYYPSSQMCSECGYINKEVKDLSVREWTCPVCGAHHDRDVNAAKNLARYGLMLSVGREPSEFMPVDRALAAEPERGLRATTG